MNGMIEVHGIIIKVMPVGDYDRRITILTRECGKIGAFARGARRQGSALMGAARVFACGTFRLYEGRDSHTLHSASVDDYFEAVSEDMESACYGSYFLELADYYAREALKDPAMLNLIYYALKALSCPSIPRKITRRIYELRLMYIEGEIPASAPKGASEAMRYTFAYIVETPLPRLFTFVVNDEVYGELASYVDRMVVRNIDKKMNSLDILQVMTEEKSEA